MNILHNARSKFLDMFIMVWMSSYTPRKFPFDLILCRDIRMKRKNIFVYSLLLHNNFACVVGS